MSSSVPSATPAHRTGRLAALLCALVALLAPAPAAALETGVVADLTWAAPRAEVDRTVALLREARVRWVRLNVNWRSVEPDAKGVRSSWALDMVDHAVRAATDAGIGVIMPIADGVPYWASGDPAKRLGSGGAKVWNPLWRPARDEDYADFVEYVARRYRPMGVRHFEIWNEPNQPRFWPSGVDAADYARLLAAAAPRVRVAAPDARVLLGGLAKSDYVYLEALYAAGAADDFDIMAVHPYTGSASPTHCWTSASTGRRSKDALCGLEEVRATMVAHGDGSKPVWLTELGWSTTTAAYGVTEAQQAAYLTAAWARLAAWPWVEVALWYGFRNVFWLQDDPGAWEANLGLLRTDFTPKPAYAAFLAITRAGADVAPVVAPVTSLPVEQQVAAAAPPPAPAGSTPAPAVTTTSAPAAAPQRTTSCRRARSARSRRARRGASRACSRSRRAPAGPAARRGSSA